MSRTPSELTMVFIARKDLKLSAGKLAAQVGHATAECITKAERTEPSLLDRYMKYGHDGYNTVLNKLYLDKK